MKNIEELAKAPGVELSKLKLGTKLYIQTQQTLYTVVVVPNDKFVVSDEGKRFVMPKEIYINGSTYGGAMLRMNWIGIGMCVEMEHPDPSKQVLTTSPVKGIKVVAPDESWYYEL
jgi:hypothetical protein